MTRRKELEARPRLCIYRLLVYLAFGVGIIALGTYSAD